MSTTGGPARASPRTATEFVHLGIAGELGRAAVVVGVVDRRTGGAAPGGSAS